MITSSKNGLKDLAFGIVLLVGSIYLMLLAFANFNSFIAQYLPALGIFLLIIGVLGILPIFLSIIYSFLQYFYIVIHSDDYVVKDWDLEN